MARQWPLVGRTKELVWAESALRRSRGVVIAGAAGVGKTALARELAARATRASKVVRWTSATETTRAIPLGAFAGLLDDRGATPSLIVRQAIRALRGDSDTEAIVVVDDAHLLDELSASVVHQLVVRGLARVVLTVRGGEHAPDAVTSLWKDEYLARRDLRPLSEPEVEQLLSEVLGGHVDQATVRRLWDLTRGNLLFLRQLVAAGRFLHKGGVIRFVSGATIPATLFETVATRLLGLPPPVIDVVDLLALGEPLDTTVVAALVDADAVEQAESAGLIDVEAGGSSLRLAHPLYGEVRRTAMGTMRARRLRGRIAAALGPDGSVLRRALLMIESDSDPDAQLLLRAGKQAIRLEDLALTERLGRAAVAAGGGFDAQLLLANGAIWVDQERAERELQVLDGLATTDEQIVRAARMHAGHAGWTRARPDDAVRIIDAAAARIDLPAQRRLLAMRTLLDSQRGKIAAVEADAPEFGVDSPFADVLLLENFALVTTAAAAGRSDDAEAAFERAVTAADHAEDIAYYRTPLVAVRVLGLIWAGHLAAAAELTARLRQAVRDLPVAEQIGSYLMGETALARGEVPTALRWLREARIGFEPFGHAGGWHYPTLIAMTQALAMSGEPAAAADAHAAMCLAQHPAVQVMEPVAVLARAWTTAAEGALRAAVAVAHEAAELARARNQQAHVVLALHTAARFGDPTVAEELAALTAEVQGPRVRAAAAHAAALAARDGDAALRAADLFEAMGESSAAADAAAHAAALHANANRTGSRQVAAARAQRLAAPGGFRTPALARLTEPVRLSGREREVVTLAAHGLSNQQIADRLGIDRRTVEGHLYRAGGKLGTGNRADFARILGIEL